MIDELPLLRSTRAGGVSAAPFDPLNLGSSSAATPDDIRENRRRFSVALGFTPEALALGEQNHGSAVAALHAEWRGTAAEVATNAAAALCRRSGVEPWRLGRCSPLVAAATKSMGGASKRSAGRTTRRCARPGHVMLDLRTVNAQQLEEA